ncbi:MAG: hypothetical protein KDH96_11890, partial [Candidatus Riesia sp.]|nr:hypothetical protein [Candidatus Riesia sp.]
LYSGAVYLGSRVYTNENYTYTLQAAASGIAEGGYSITLSGLGFTLPSGNGYYTGTSPTFVERITSTLTSLDNGIDTAERDRISAATSVLTKTNRLELAPSFARKNYRCRLSWSAVSEINNEAIKCYQVRIYKLNPLSQGGVSNGLAVKTLENDYGKILEVKNDQTYERVTILSGFVSGTPDAVTQTLIGGYSGTVLWDTNYNTYNVRVGDIVTQGSNNYYVTQVYSNSGLLLDRYAFASPTPVIIYREMLDTYSSDTRYDFDIYADQYYYIYVRAVSQYGISSDWSSGLKLATNSLTNDAGHTLLNIINSDELLLAKTNEVRNVVYTQKLNSLITSLQRQVEDTPTRTTVDNLATRVKQIEIS